MAVALAALVAWAGRQLRAERTLDDALTSAERAATEAHAGFSVSATRDRYDQEQLDAVAPAQLDAFPAVGGAELYRATFDGSYSLTATYVVDAGWAGTRCLVIVVSADGEPASVDDRDC